MVLNEQAADRIERFLDGHPGGPLVVCVGSASVAGVSWLAQRTRHRPVTLLIGRMQGPTFGQGNTADQKIALDFINRNDVKILNWYRTQRSKQGKADANLKVWSTCDEDGTPEAYLVGSANLTKAGLHHNIELMTLANDISDRHYLEQTLRDLQAEAWDAKDRLRELIEDKQEPSSEAHVGVAGTSATSARSKAPSSPSVSKKASTGCGTHVLAGVALVASLGLLLAFRRWCSRL